MVNFVTMQYLRHDKGNIAYHSGYLCHRQFMGGIPSLVNLSIYTTSVLCNRVGQTAAASPTQ